MKMRKGRRAPLLALAAVALIAASTLAATPGVPPRTVHGSLCRTERAAGVPAWVTSGVEVNGRFLVVDVNGHRLFEISRSGVADELKSALGDFVASRGIQRVWQGDGQAGQSFLAEFDNENVLTVNDALVPQKNFKMISSGRKSGSFEVGTVFNSTIMRDGNRTEVFGYADLAKGNLQEAPRAEWRNGFVRYYLDDADFSLVAQWQFPGDQRTLMKLTYPMIASIGRTAYVVNQEGNRLELQSFGPGDKELHSMNAFPEHLKGELAPMLPSFAKAEEYVRTMKVAEESTMPVGLYAWERALYILSRSYKQGKPGIAAERKWFLSKIDPSQDTLLWTVQVPGSSPHMMAIPGRAEWAFLGKGTVLGVQNQVTEEIQFVSSSQLMKNTLAALCY